MPTYCIPQVVGVPGRESTKLDWWTTSATPLVNYPEDPNWLGSFSLGEGTGTQAQVQFRALSGLDGDNHYLYLSWIVSVQPNQPVINQDGLTVLIGDGTNYIAIKVRLATDSTMLDADQTTAYAIDTHNYTVAGLSGPHSPPASWATGTGRAWIGYPSPISTILPTPVIPWAFQLRVPLDVNLAPAGSPAVTLPLNASFKLWWQLNVTVQGAGGVVEYPWPGTPFATSEINFIPSGLTPPDVALPGTPGCVSGVTLDRNQIGIEDVTTGAQRTDIQLDLTNTPPDVSSPQHQNVFFARPTGLTVPQQSSVRADFRLANWGTQFNVPTPNSWKIVPGGENVLYQSASGPFGSEFRFTWPKPPLAAIDPFTTDFITGVKLFNSTGGTSGQNPHQCMLVEMLSTDPSVVFTKSSEFNNLRAVNASTFREVAEVSVVGNPPISPQPRDIYLYLQTMGMPRVVDDNYRERMSRSLRAGMTSSAPATFGDGRTTTLSGIFDFASTYQVHAYYDTGQKLQLKDGTTVKILRPQTSFGYIAFHGGNLVGWETRLYGAEKLTENLYVVRVPNDASVRVTVAIQARESGSEAPLPPDGAPSGCLCMIWTSLKKLLGL